MARAAIRNSEQRRHELNGLATALAEAAAEYEPHRPTLAAAERTATDARSAVADARRRLHNADRCHRRDAHQELAATEQHLVAATSHLERVEAVARDRRDRFNDLRIRDDAIRRTEMHRGILDRWGNHKVRAEQLEELLDAVDIWTQWTHGHDIPTDRLTRSGATIDLHGRHSMETDVQQLAATVQLWAAHAGIALARPTTIDRDLPARPQRNGLDLGLGR